MARSKHSSNATTEFGRRLRARREQLGLSQLTVGQQAGLHFTYISDVERGQRNPSLITMLRLSRALDIDLATLVQDLPQDDPAA